MVNRAFDKIRQAGGDMPAVVIRLLDAITHVVEHTTESAQRQVLRRQADMILRAADDAVAEANDLADIHRRFDNLVLLIGRIDRGTGSGRLESVGEHAESLAGQLPGAR
jgi:uncharacterized membrane protein